MTTPDRMTAADWSGRDLLHYLRDHVDQDHWWQQRVDELGPLAADPVYAVVGLVHHELATLEAEGKRPRATAEAEALVSAAMLSAEGEMQEELGCTVRDYVRAILTKALATPETATP